jgi:PAS domain S-box-containing protein
MIYRKHTAVFVFLTGLLLGIAFWLGDTAFHYYFGHGEMRHFIMLPPEHFLDACFTHVSPHVMFIRILFLAGSLLAGALVAFYIQHHQNTFEHLVQAQEQLHAITHNMPVMLVGYDKEGQIKAWNRECTRITGYAASEIIDQDNAIIRLYPDEYYRWNLETEWKERGRHYTNWERILTCKDGTQRTIRWSNVSAVAPAPGWDAWEIGIDVTRQKQAEQALLTSEARFRHIYESGMIGILYWKKDGLITDANDAALAILGASRMDLEQGRLNWRTMTPPEYADLDDWAMLQIGQTGLCTPYEKVYITLSNRRIYVWQGAARLDQTGDVGISFILDVGERVKLELQLRQEQKDLEKQFNARSEELNERIRDSDRLNRAMMNLLEDLQGTNRHLQRTTQQLEAANRELESFAYSVSHDLRAPLRAIDGFSRAIEEDYQQQLDEQGKDYLQRVRSASQRMGQLIDDILNLSRLTRGAMQYQAVDLSALAHEILEELREQSPERQVKITITPDLTVQGDPTLLRAAMTNLLGNAWKFSSQRSLTRIKFGVDEQQDSRVYYVKDNGAGFDMAFADKLFGAFQRLHKAREFPGTGIGLATVQRIIHRHGGKIWAESTPDQGATFFFTLE